MKAQTKQAFIEQMQHFRIHGTRQKRIMEIMTTKSKKIRPVKLNHKTKSGYDYEHTILLILDFAGIKYTYGIDGYGRNDIYIILA